MITQFTMANAEVKYLEVPIVNGAIGWQLSWHDATTSATVTLELTSFKRVSPTAAGAAWEWKDSGLTFTGPAGSAAGALLINVENVRQRRARVKIVAAAACSFDYREGMGE